MTTSALDELLCDEPPHCHEPGPTWRVLTEVWKRPGLTAPELAHYVGQPLWAVWNRLTDLRAQGKVRPGERRLVPGRKKPCQTWYPHAK